MTTHIEEYLAAQPDVHPAPRPNDAKSMVMIRQNNQYDAGNGETDHYIRYGINRKDNPFAGAHLQQGTQ